MKIRNGFVSNSSSSSFVVIFPKEPKNAEDVKKMLFKEEQYYYDPWNEDKWTTEEVAETVWEDICNQNKNNFVRAKEILTGSISGANYEDFKHIEDSHERWSAYSDARNIFAEKRLNEFFSIKRIRKEKLKKLKNETVQLTEDGVLYCFSYCDNDSSYSAALEHGDLFKNLKHIEINNH